MRCSRYEECLAFQGSPASDHSRQEFRAAWYTQSQTSLSCHRLLQRNQSCQSVDGHLYRTDGTLLTYAPAADRYGVLPEETVAIDKEAFCLLPSPFEKVYIPSSVENIEPRWDEWFYEAEVAHDNPFFKSIDGSIFSADGKMLVCAKLSLDGYIVPDGTETICDMALCQVHGTVFIPGSVTKIENAYGLGRHITGICTPKGSCAEAYAQKHHIPVELVWYCR